MTPLGRLACWEVTPVAYLAFGKCLNFWSSRTMSPSGWTVSLPSLRASYSGGLIRSIKSVTLLSNDGPLNENTFSTTYHVIQGYSRPYFSMIKTLKVLPYFPLASKFQKFSAAWKACLCHYVLTFSQDHLCIFSLSMSEPLFQTVWNSAASNMVMSWIGFDPLVSNNKSNSGQRYVPLTSFSSDYISLMCHSYVLR